MNSQERIVITAWDAISAIGSTGEETYAAIKAGLAAFDEHPLLTCTPTDPEWEERLPMYVASVPTVGAHVQGIERFVKLSMSPLTGVLKHAGLARKDLERTALLCALPQERPGLAQLDLASYFIPTLCKRLGLHPKIATGDATGGRTGMMHQLMKACALLEAGEADYCIVLGVDTHLINEHLKWLDEAWQLKSGRNVDGFIPGEAASALLIERKSYAQSRGVKPLAVLSGMGFGMEPEPFGGSRVSTGQGLSTALRDILAGQGESRSMSNIYSDFNGMSEYAFELGLMQSRLAPIFENCDGIQHPADCYGDIGAATGGVLAGCAISDLQTATDKTNSVLIWCCADSGERTALRLDPA